MMGESRNQYTLLFRCCVVLGLVLRCWHYFRNPCVWMDEAATLVNVINLDCSGHLGPLLLDSATPPLYLMLLRCLTLPLNDGVLVLRSVSILSSCCSLLLVASLARQLLVPMAATIAVLLFSVSDSLLFHACEAKPYSSDVCLAAFVAWLYLRTRTWLLTAHFLLGAVLAPLMIWFSYPACFILGGWLLAEFRRMFHKETPWMARGAYLLFAASAALSFFLLLVGPIKAQSTSAMRDCWVDGFPNWSKPLEVPLWSILQAGEVARYIAPPWGSAFLFFAFWGARVFYKCGTSHRTLLVLLVTPVVAAWLASLLGRYPFMAARVMAYAAPAVVLLTGAGIADLLPRIWKIKLCRAWAVVIVLYVLIPLGYSLYIAVVPWSRPPSDVVSEFVLKQREPHVPVLYNHWDFEYYLRKLPRDDRKLYTDADTPEWIVRQKAMWMLYTSSVRPERCPFQISDGFKVTRVACFYMTTVYYAVKE